MPYSFLLTLFQQHVLGYSPLRSGLSYLPLGLAIGIGIAASTGLTPKVGVKVIGAVSFAAAGVGLWLTSLITPDSSYLRGLLPGMLVLGFFAGATMPAMTNAALHNVTGQDSGLASGVQTTAQQVGSALGLATLVTLAVRVAGDKVASGIAPTTAATDGFVLSFRIGAVLLGSPACSSRCCSSQASPHPRSRRPTSPPPQGAETGTVSSATPFLFATGWVCMAGDPNRGAGGDVAPVRAVVAVRPDPGRALTGPVAAVCAAVVAVELAFAARYGYHRDELYFLAAGRHLAWGYPDQGPLTPAIARLMSAIGGGSLLALRLPSALAAGPPWRSPRY